MRPGLISVHYYSMHIGYRQNFSDQRCYHEDTVFFISRGNKSSEPGTTMLLLSVS